MKKFLDENYIDTKGLVIFLSSLLILISIITGTIVALKDRMQESIKICEKKNENERIPIYSFDLVNISEGNVQGSFSFVHGYVYGNYEEESYYVFYKILDDGGKVIIRIPTESATLYNNENENPYILKNTTCYMSKWTTPVEKTEYKIYVPENALQQEYEGNLSNLK